MSWICTSQLGHASAWTALTASSQQGHPAVNTSMVLFFNVTLLDNAEQPALGFLDRAITSIPKV